MTGAQPGCGQEGHLGSETLKLILTSTGEWKTGGVTNVFGGSWVVGAQSRSVSLSISSGAALSRLENLRSLPVLFRGCFLKYVTPILGEERLR